MDIDEARDQFGPFEEGRVWLNCAHQGPLPLPAQAAARGAIREKSSPHLLEGKSFWELPEQLRSTIADLIGGSRDEVILGNATSYGLNLLAHGLPLEPGDEVLLVEGDFPATVTTWLPLRERGIEVRLLRPRSGAPTGGELEAALSPRTRVFCTSWVFSFTGYAIDLDAIGDICRRRGVTFVLNATQAVGVRRLDVATAPVDAVVGAGFKWLCGPYATGYCWMTPDLLQQLTYEQRYWLAQMEPGDLSKEGAYDLSPNRTVRDYDLFCTANFMVFRPWLAALRFLLSVGVDEIERYDQHLVDMLVEGIGRIGLELVSPSFGAERSTLVYLRAGTEERTRALYEALLDAGVHVAIRKGQVRISPHLYNTVEDIEAALRVLRRAR